MTENTPSDTPPLTQTAGGLLKAARQSAGIHLAVLSVNLKVPVRQLEALEADLYLFDQSPVFARGLVASVCRQLRVDPAPILALMPMSGNYLESNGAMRQTQITPANLGRMLRAPSGMANKTGWVAAGMLMLIAALIWLPNPGQWSWFENLTYSWTAPESSVSTSAPVSPVEPISPTGAKTHSVSQEPVSTQAAVAQPSLPLVTENQPELVFSAQNLSWIEVRDVQKQLIWNGVLNAGDTKRLPLSRPVFVVVGRSDAIQLSVNGQPFDLQPYTQVNTARFEVKP
jgi:cytoskeleton protein RodZ